MIATRSFECLACGSMLEFNAGSLSARCATCEDARPLPLRIASDIPEIATQGTEPEPEVPGGRTVAQCTACKAIVSATAGVGTCPFCDVPTTTPAGPQALLRPQGQLPFLVDEQVAAGVLRVALARAGIAGVLPRLRAVYVPWLILRFHVKGEYDGRRGERDHDGEGRSQVNWFDVSGFLDRVWENKTACASLGLPSEHARRLEPWDWAFCEPYSPEALGDALVEHSMLGVRELFRKAVPRWETDLADEVRTDIGGDLQEIHRVESSREDEHARVVLMPVWVGRLGDEHRTRVVVNGRTGEAEILDLGLGRRDELDEVPSHNAKSSLRYVAVVALLCAATLVWLAWR